MRQIFYLLFCIIYFQSVNAQLLINEYSAANYDSYQDNYGEYEDWVELYNPTAAAIDLNGWALSDKVSNPLKWIFPASFNIPVVNAANHGPHKSFNFNIYPKNIKHYKNILLNLKKVKPVKGKKKKIYTYYLMRHLLDYNLLDNFRKTLGEMKTEYHTGEVFNVFLNQFGRKRNKEIIKIYDNFIKSRKFRIFAENLTKKSKFIFFN